LRIAFVGVHGVGKSTLAHALSKRLKIPSIELECIHEASRLNPIHRQILFLSTFTSEFLRGLMRFKSVIFSSHPLMVPIYTEYWVGRKESTYMYEIVSKLPVIDYIFVLHAPVNVVIKRILMRGREVSKEEIREDYINYIQDRTLMSIPILRRLAHRVVVVDTNKPLSILVNELIQYIEEFEVKVSIKY